MLSLGILDTICIYTYSESNWFLQIVKNCTNSSIYKISFFINFDLYFLVLELIVLAPYYN